MLLKLYYKITHKGCKDEDIPYYFRRSIFGEIIHLLRKGVCQNIAPNCVLNPVRVFLYRLCGFEIGKGTFIGMKCYLDDLCYDKMRIGDNVIISYGVYFACHGPGQEHNTITIKNGAYIGMRASVIATSDIEIGEGAIVGAQTLVNKSIPSGKVAVGIPCKLLENKDGTENE
ncbi:MAG: acyltransferase [Bacteroidota bacterium]|nr:acyltransferase [Bacteroidota bacterium]